MNWKALSPWAMTPVVLFSLLTVARLAAVEPAPAPEYDWQSKTPPPAPAPAEIRVNSVGFLPDARKVATVRGVDRPFRIIDLATKSPVLSGRTAGQWKTEESDTGGETLSTADFSSLTSPGTYQIEVDGALTSSPFTVGASVWADPFRLVARGFYLWRCGTEIDEQVPGRHYHQKACHLNDGYLDHVGGPKGERRASVGGWHDAGDYNKYVVNAGVTLGFMLKAWEEHRPAVDRIALHLPESGRGWPDLLAETKFEFDWLFTMQTPDGRVYHKLSEENFRYWGMPDLDTGKRYFTPWSTSATADFSAVMALGARLFREFDPAYADRCLAASRLAWQALLAHPADQPADLTGFHTGAYQTLDPAHRIWACAELWVTTGEEEYLREFERRADKESFTDGGPGWGNMQDFALAAYLRCARPGRNEALVARLRQDVVARADKIAATAKANAHARPLGTARSQFYWGCNATVVSQVFLLSTASFVSPQRAYRDATEDALSHLFGRNYHGRSYVTGVGYQPPAFTHDRRGHPQLPGYLVGGPFPTAVHWYDQWKDPSRNEIAINWNGALLYALAGVLDRP